MKFTTKYITPNDYLNYFGENLDSILPPDDKPSGKADRFIKQVEDEVAMMLEVCCFKRIDEEYYELTDHQKYCYKMALLMQAKYKIKNGNLANESGYNPNSGRNITTGELEQIELSRQTRKYLSLAGLWTTKIKTTWRGGGYFPFIK